MPVKECRKTLRNRWIVRILPSKLPEKIFQGVADYHRNYLDGKRPNLTRRIASVSVRQEPLRLPSLADWRRNCSPELTCVIPSKRYVSHFVLKTSKIWKVLFIPDPNLFIPDPRLSLIAHTSETVYSYRIQIIHTTLKACDNHWLKKTFAPYPNLFIPGLKY